MPVMLCLQCSSGMIHRLMKNLPGQYECTKCGHRFQLDKDRYWPGQYECTNCGHRFQLDKGRYGKPPINEIRGEAFLMTGSITTMIEGIGPVLFERSKRARRVNIYVRPFKGVRVAVPGWLSLKKAEEFVRARKDWIQKHQSRMKQIEREYESIPRDSTDIDRVKAKRNLTRRLKYLAEKHGYTYHRVFIRNQRTGWGSCSPYNNISLNPKLVRLPDELLDYVILHELVHTQVKNHRNEFWAEIDRIVGNGKGLDTKLRGYDLGVLRPYQ